MDVYRHIETNLDSPSERTINDYWNVSLNVTLSDRWTGKTQFTILRPRPPPGYTWVDGRLTKVQQTSRPDSAWPEVWMSTSKKQKKLEIQKWEEEKPKLKAARDDRGIYEIPADDKDYLRTIAEARAKLSLPESPAMPLTLTCDPGSGGGLHGCGGERNHEPPTSRPHFT